MAHGKMGPKGPKTSLAGKKGTNRPARGKGSTGGKLHNRLTPPHPSIQRGSMGGY